MKRIIYGCAVLIASLAVLAGCSTGTEKAKTAEKGTETEVAAEKTEAMTEKETGTAAMEGITGGKPDEKAEYQKITAEEAKKMMEDGGVTVVDVRTQEEYEEGHISGSVVVPVESIGDELPKALPDTDAVLLVHCRSGVRSKAASQKLIDLGYKNVYDFGGIKDWPYETVKGAE